MMKNVTNTNAIVNLLSLSPWAKWHIEAELNLEISCLDHRPYSAVFSDQIYNPIALHGP